MFDTIIRFSLRNRLVVVVLAALLLAYGLSLTHRLPIDVFPDLNRPTVTIFTEAEGLAPEEVEMWVTRPIEWAMSGTAKVERVRSNSVAGLSLVFVEFAWDQDIYLARQMVSERLNQIARQLPAGIQPTLGPISSIMGEIMLVGLVSEDGATSLMQLREIADWQIRPRLSALSGIAQITVIGGEVRQYQVLVDPIKMQVHGVSLHTLEEAVRQSNQNGSGGWIIGPHTEKIVRILARAHTAEELGQTVLAMPKKPGAPPLVLSDIAEVRIASALAPRGSAGVQGRPAVILSIQKQPKADTLALTETVERELSAIQSTLPAGVHLYPNLFRQSDFIQRAIHNVIDAMRDGSFLVVIVLLIFLMNWRTTLITLTALPISIIITLIVFDRFGLSVNTMTLGGLAIAIGELVDDAIVDVENVLRRLKENAGLASPRPAFQIIFEASKEVRSSIVFATWIVILVFVPLFALEGIEGKVFAPLGIAYVTSILVSLAVALTVTPALCSYLLSNIRIREERKDTWLVHKLKKTEEHLLNWAMTRSRLVLATLGTLLLISIFCVAWMGKEFLPPFNEGSVNINVMLSPQTSLEESSRVGIIAEKLLLEVPEVSTTGRRTGRAELDDHAQGVYSNEIEVNLKPSSRSREEILADLRSKLEQIPGVAINIGQPISHRIDHLLSGVQAQIAVKLFGDNLDTLRQKAEEVRAAMATVEGVVDLQVEKQVLLPQLHIAIDRSRARLTGVAAGEAAEYVELATRGKKLSQISEGERTYDVVLRLEEYARNSAEALARLPIDTVSGELVPLSLIANIHQAPGPNLISRENGRRHIVIAANASGRDLVGIVAAIQKRVHENVKLPQGYYLSYGGQFESQARASQMIFMLGALALVGMFILLYFHFKSALFALQVMLNIPFALIGAVAGVMLMGGVLSIPTLVGFVTLTGISARNGIMMISHYMHLMQHEGERWSYSMILRGTQERIVPVMMTALTACLGLLPLALAAGQPGKEILHPVAVVILSGLLTSTLLDFIVTPVVFYKWGKRSVERLLPEAIQI